MHAFLRYGGQPELKQSWCPNKKKQTGLKKPACPKALF